MIRYREIRPSAQVQSFVHAFWILETDGEDATPQRIVPDGHSELILNFGQPFESLQNGRWVGQPRSFLAGQIDGPLLLRPNGPARMLGIGFRAHGAACVLPQPMHDLSGRFTPIQDLSRTLARGLEDALTTADPIAAAEAALLSAQRNNNRYDALVGEAVRRITVAKGGSDLAALAGELGLGIRQFERRFLATVGLSPKFFCRIERLNHLFPLVEQESRNWVDTAIACGYYDQAHLIRDCKRLSGQTPAILLSDEADLARHFYRRFGMSHSYNTARRVAV